MIYFISDPHIGHSKIIEMCNRPYDSIEDMDNDFISKWNKKVQHNDIIFIIGDLVFSHKPDGVKELLSKLKGRKILIVGNHDLYLEKSSFDKSLFEDIQDYYELKYKDSLFVLSHYPLTSWNKSRYGSYHLHGHSHNKKEYNTFNIENGIRKYDVGFDANDGTPVSIEEIIEKFGDNFEPSNLSLNLPRHQQYKELMTTKPHYFRDLKYLEIITDFDIIKEYELSSRVEIGVKHRSSFNTFVVDLVKTPEGKYFPYERNIPSKEGGVVVVPVYKDKVVFQHINRHATRSVELELPRGHGEDNVSSFNVIKELSEELNAKVSSCENIGYVYADTGLTSTRVDIVVCYLDSFSDNVGHEGLVKSELFSLEDIVNGLLPKELRCGLSISALFKFIDQQKRLVDNISEIKPTSKFNQ